MHEIFVYLLGGLVVLAFAVQTLKNTGLLVLATRRGLRERAGWFALRSATSSREMSPAEREIVQMLLLNWKLELDDPGVRELEGKPLKNGYGVDTLGIGSTPLIFPYDSCHFLREGENHAEVVLTRSSALVLTLNGFSLVQSYQDTNGAPLGSSLDEGVELISERLETDEEVQARMPRGLTTLDHALLISLFAIAGGAFAGSSAASLWGFAVVSFFLVMALIIRFVYRAGQRAAQTVRLFRGRWACVSRVHDGRDERGYSLAGVVALELPRRVLRLNSFPSPGEVVEVEVVGENNTILSVGGYWSLLDERYRNPYSGLARMAMVLAMLSLAWFAVNSRLPSIESSASLAWVWLSGSQRVYENWEDVLKDPPVERSYASLHAQGRCALDWEPDRFAPELDCQRILWGGAPPIPALELPPELMNLYFGSFLQVSQPGWLTSMLRAELGYRMSLRTSNMPRVVDNLRQVVDALNTHCQTELSGCLTAKQQVAASLTRLGGQRLQQWSEVEELAALGAWRTGPVLITGEDVEEVRASVRALTMSQVRDQVASYIVSMQAPVILFVVTPPEETTKATKEGLDLPSGSEALEAYWRALTVQIVADQPRAFTITGFVNKLESVPGERLTIHMDTGVSLEDGRAAFFQVAWVFIATLLVGLGMARFAYLAWLASRWRGLR